MSVKWKMILLGLLAFIVISALGFAAVRAVLIRLPADYFSNANRHAFWAGAHPIVRWTGVILKNILGGALAVAGLVLALPGVPGPGLLVVVLGLALMDFP